MLTMKEIEKRAGDLKFAACSLATNAENWMIRHDAAYVIVYATRAQTLAQESKYVKEHLVKITEQIARQNFSYAENNFFRAMVM